MTAEEPIRGVSTWAAVEPERPAFFSGDRVVTYAEFDDRTTRAARVLGDRGVGAGDRVAIMLPNSVEFFEVWAAAMARSTASEQSASRCWIAWNDPIGTSNWMRSFA